MLIHIYIIYIYIYFFVYETKARYPYDRIIPTLQTQDFPRKTDVKLVVVR